MAGKFLFKVLKNLAFLVIGLVLLYLAFKGQDLEKLITDLKSANYFYVLLSVLFGMGAYFARAARWLILLEPMGYTPKLSNSLYSIIIGYFANLAIPRIGEITRCTTLNQAENIPVDKLFGTVILERIIDLMFLASLTVVTILLKVDLFGGFFFDLLSSNKEKYPKMMNLIIISGFIIIFLLTLLYFLRSRLGHFKFVYKIRTFFLGIKEGLISIKKIKNKRWFIFHSLSIWVCYYLMSWVVFYSIEETSNLGLIDGLFILVVGGFGMSAPVQGGIGAYHFIVSLGLGVLGIASAPALSYATIVHTSQTLFILLAGSVSLALLYVSNKKIKNTNPGSI